MELIILVAVGLFCAVLLIFLAIREIVCWYFKINEFMEAFRELSTDVKAIRSQIWKPSDPP